MNTGQIRQRVSDNISVNLRKFRAIQRISQRKLAQKTNLDQSAVAKLETGKRKMLAEELPLFAEALGVSIDELLN